jgi:hypothetical protein
MSADQTEYAGGEMTMGEVSRGLQISGGDDDLAVRDMRGKTTR